MNIGLGIPSATAFALCTTYIQMNVNRLIIKRLSYMLVLCVLCVFSIFEFFVFNLFNHKDHRENYTKVTELALMRNCLIVNGSLAKHKS